MIDYYIRYKIMGGTWYYMIYKRILCFHVFYERWNDSETVVERLKELK